MKSSFGIKNILCVNTIFKIILSPTLALCLYSQAFAETVAGNVIIVSNSVTANNNVHTDSVKNVPQSSTASQQQERKLKRKSQVLAGDVITTGKNSLVQLRMADGAIIALAQNSTLQIKQYDFNADENSGTIKMALLGGSFRAVSGTLKIDGNNYQLKTPNGVMSVRGTHYEIEIIGGELFIAVWDGAIDVSVEVGGAEQSISFGEGEDYSYASVDEAGTVTPMLQPPENFEQGHSSDPEQDQEEYTAETSPDDSQAEHEAGITQQEMAAEGEGGLDSGVEGDAEQQFEQTANSDETTDFPPEEEIFVPPEEEFADLNSEPLALEDSTLDLDQAFDQQTESELPPATPSEFLAELVLAKTGTVTFNSVTNANITSTSGLVTNFNASSTVDFDQGIITNGNLSFDDAGGEWFAAFDGILNVEKIEIDINFASHGNNRADGDIKSVFTDGVDEITTHFELFEIEQPSVNVQGEFESR